MNRLQHVSRATKIRKVRVRAKITGTAERPRLSVRITNLHVSAQIIDDSLGKTLVAGSTVGTKTAGNLTKKAAFIGEEVAKKATKAKIKQVVFDRNGRQYAGRLKALAEAVRKEGIKV